jgi:hypothetical protein
MPDQSSDKAADAPLNPALKSRTETVYDTTSTTPTPYDSASAKEGQGEGWPIIWLIVAVVGVLLAVYFVI